MPCHTKTPEKLSSHVKNAFLTTQVVGRRAVLAQLEAADLATWTTMPIHDVYDNAS